MAKKGKGGGSGGANTSGVTVISGTSGDDILSAEGGVFQLEGGKGNDTYIIDDAEDSIKERRSAGTDEVQSSIDYILGDHLENLTLTGSDDLTGTGNSLDNVLIGNSGDNTLMGMDGDDTLDGAAGNDVLDGGAGTDTALFDGSISDYTFEVVNGEILVTAISGEVDRLINIEFLQFADQTVAADDLPTDTSPPPAPPQANDDAIAIAEDTSVRINVLDNDSGNGLSVSNVSYSGSGSVVVNADGTLDYTPGADWYGQDSFTYQIVDESGSTATATVTVDVASVNDGPNAVNDSYSVDGSTTFSGGSVTANDTDADGDAVTVQSHDQASAQGGTVQVNADGSFSYTAPTDFSGTDSFGYTISDGNGGTDSATVSLTVTQPDSQPAEIPYYVTGLIYEDELWRLNATEEAGTAVTVTYTFLDATPSYIPTSDPRGVHETFEAFTEQQRSVTRDILKELSDATGITFVEVASAEDAVVTFGIYDMGGDTKGTATYPMGVPTGNVYSDVWIDTQTAGTSFESGTEGFYVLLHEIGHAIGLDHPTLPNGEENRQYTVMDYTDHPTIATDSTGYQLYDLAALQYLYGANTTATAGDDTYTFADLDGQSKALWDAGGHDTIDLSGAVYGVTVNLNAGSFSTIIDEGSENLSIAFDTLIEDVIGSDFDDILIGNTADNTFAGGAGRDSFVFEDNWGQDRITDFEVGQDQLDFSSLGLTTSDFAVTEADGDTLLEYGADSVLLVDVVDVTADMLVA